MTISIRHRAKLLIGRGRDAGKCDAHAAVMAALVVDLEDADGRRHARPLVLAGFGPVIIEVEVAPRGDYRLFVAAWDENWTKERGGG